MPKTSKLRPYLAAAIVNLTCLCLGISIGWISPAAPALLTDPPPIGGNKALTTEQISWLGSLHFVGGIIGVVSFGKIAEKFGRKICGYLISIPLLIGWITIILAQNYIWLFVGKLLMGFGSTGALILVPLYVSEISEDSYRGALGSFIMLFYNLGVVVAYFVGSIMDLKNMTIFCSSMPIFFLICYYFLPESPVFLFIKGKKNEAKKSLLWLRSGNVELVEKELSVLQSLVSSNESSVSISKLFENKGSTRAMTISLGLFFFQIFCGILMLLTYTSIILIESEIEFSPNTATFIVGLLQFVASWAASLIMDRVDRRTLLVFSNSGMAVVLFIAGLFFYLKENFDENILPNWTPFICICLHMVFYSAAASMPYVITSEILIPEVRPLAFSITISWGTAVSFTSVKIFTVLVDNFHMYGNFWFFTLGSVLAAIFTVMYVPETRGKSLIVILKELNGNNVVSEHTITKADYTEIPITDPKEGL